MTPQAVGYAADRGKAITENNDLKLMEYLRSLFT
jgi:hypothetical protein